MTFNEIEKIMLYISAIDGCDSYSAFETLVFEIKNYLGDRYKAKLSCDSLLLSTDDITEDDLKREKLLLISFLNGQLDFDPNTAEVKNIIKDIEKGKKSIGNIREQENFVTYSYTAYNGKINFPKNVVDFCSGSRAAKYQFQSSINASIVEGIIQSLKNYAIGITKPIQKEASTSIQNIFSPANNVKVDIQISIDSARESAENAGLSQTQLDEVNKKIDEIQRLLESKEPKNRIWSKAGSILKWVAEQGIQVASFMVPLLCTLV